MSSKLRVVTTCQHFCQAKTPQENLDYFCGLIDEGAAVKPGLIVLPEAWPSRGCESGVAPQRFDGPLVARIREKAAALGCYIVCAVHEERENGLFNTSLVIDRSGELAGRYDKIHRTEGELRRGLLPGPYGRPPIETDFGLLGCQICFDTNWLGPWVD